ncbi:meiosis-specific protein HOP1 [Kluyveromyces marxianus DMKU3-1042]|uniref:Meiosis-specific protein HOP1 n=1 Tax=Kluyveromyces marxianus (strain DMKU3-1042 / BCC 29191 / NBRC 104275) TaxID=1003335 RepID=W0TAK4_KLUMD|nr:meiosis-specific protein HOP1 [Kluyveromyces marxianus DMKU3-1042]BAO40435.1 meiosis-specific protein HOP1 [Kluyveromyces marxianus DMKU3-1042]
MSTIQKVRQREEVAIKNAISQDQSQKLVQTMITMCFGCLAFLRGLFPDDNFVDQKFVPEKCNKDYDKFSASSIRIKTLVRDKSEEADLFLDWLENGVFQSLKKGYLKAISLGIFIDENNPNDLIETYLFSFKYSQDSISISINDQTDTISLLDSRKMVQQLMRRFIIITQSLDPLPEKRFLTMRLMFNENAPSEYQPKLFKDATKEPPTLITLPKGNELETFSVGSLNTSVHKVGLKVLSLADNAIQQQLTTGPTTQLDPFDMLEENIELPQETPENSQMTMQSQTTKMLQNYLKSSPAKCQPTQAMQSEEKTTVTEAVTKQRQLRCMSCKKFLLAICYGNESRRFIPECVECLTDGKLDTNSRNFQRFMTTRKIYRYMAKKPDFPHSFSDLVSVISGPSASASDKSIVSDSLSVLLMDEVFLVEEDVRVSYSGTQLRSSGFIEVDTDEIVSPSGPLKRGKYAWTFMLHSAKAHSFYTEHYAKTEAQLQQLLKECSDTFQKMRETLVNNESSNSLALHKLNINDTEKTSLGNDSVVKKRSYNDDIDDETQGESDLDTQDNQHQGKVRKISVSKKTLKSAW